MFFPWFQEGSLWTHARYMHQWKKFHVLCMWNGPIDVPSGSLARRAVAKNWVAWSRGGGAPNSQAEPPARGRGNFQPFFPTLAPFLPFILSNKLMVKFPYLRWGWQCKPGGLSALHQNWQGRGTKARRRTLWEGLSLWRHSPCAPAAPNLPRHSEPYFLNNNESGIIIVKEKLCPHWVINDPGSFNIKTLILTLAKICSSGTRQREWIFKIHS